MRVVSRPATVDDVRTFYPDQTCSFKARVAEVDGELAGIVGISLTRPIRSIFCTFKDILRPHLKCLTILRLLKWLEAEIQSQKLPVFAIRERGEPKAVHILKRLGFRFWDVVEGDAVYRFEGGVNG